jgi:hypothetical protein
LKPIISVLVGIGVGCFLSLCMTLFIFLFTLVRTPMHIGKMLYVTAKNEEYFHGHFSTIMRTLVFSSVPFVHVLFLVAITLISATVGTMFHIGAATKGFYNQEFIESMIKIQSNIRLEPESLLGKYVKLCQDFMREDEYSICPICVLKFSWALLPSLALSSFAVFPFTLCAVAITLYRLPINVYKTIKIATFTVVLKWDLRLVVLIVLPIAHVLFPGLIFLGSIVWSLFWTWGQTTDNIFRGANPFHKWNELQEKLQQYYKAHQDFVGTHCDRFDHVTGIPDGWDGTRYGLEIQRVLKWQRDLVVCCVLILVEAPVCVTCAIIISSIKYVPTCIHAWREYASDGCKDWNSCLVLWPFHLLFFVLLPAGVLLVECILVVGTIPFVAARVIGKLLCQEERRAGGFCFCVAAWNVQFELIWQYDELTGHMCNMRDFKVFPCLSAFAPTSDDPGAFQVHHSTREGAASALPERKICTMDAYWDRFVSQCISTTSMLLQDGFITLEEVEGLEPSAIQCIPAMAVLTILIDSVTDEENPLPKDGLKWNIDGTICKGRDGLHENDRIAHHLWPSIVATKTMLQTNKQQVLTPYNIPVLTAMLCSDKEQATAKVRSILNGAAIGNEETQEINKTLRTSINRLAMSLLRVKPYQSRMDQIFTFQYDHIETVEQEPAGSKTMLAAAPNVPPDEETSHDASSVQCSEEE